jgi:hypothetical protein
MRSCHAQTLMQKVFTATLKEGGIQNIDRETVVAEEISGFKTWIS